MTLAAHYSGLADRTRPYLDLFILSALTGADLSLFEHHPPRCTRRTRGLGCDEQLRADHHARGHLGPVRRVRGCAGRSGEAL